MNFLRMLCLLLFAASTVNAQSTSKWVYPGEDGRLHYTEDERGNRIMDFSNAGYRGGGVLLPLVPVLAIVKPSGGDDTTNIQAAIDKVASITSRFPGLRGAVLLLPETYNVSQTLNITASGVVLRGTGSGKTMINMTGDPFLFLRVAGTGSWQTTGTTSTTITDSYVPAGAKIFKVADASAFKVGDPILIGHPVTAEWIHFMGMDTLVRSGQPQTWISPGSIINTDRNIAAIQGNQITLDVPLSDSLDSQFLGSTGATLSKYEFPGRISEIGVEDLTVVAHPVNVDITQPQFTGLNVTAAINVWARNITYQDTQNTVTISGNVRQMTLDNIKVEHTVVHSGDGPADFALSGTQLLANKCSVTGMGNTWAAVTQSRVTGPVVLLNFFADDRGFDPHQRWATGLLCDNCNFSNSRTADKAGVAYSNRGILGSGQGWDAGWGVAWNTSATTFLIQQPPGANNFCIGCIGTVLSEPEPGGDGTLLPNGVFDSLGTKVSPASLYLAQLCERRGPIAVAEIGYPGVCHK